MTAQEAKQRLERIWKDYTSAYDTVSIEDLMAFEMATNSLGAIEQIQWERDMAIKQLHDLGYGLGEKPRVEVKKSNNLIERQKAIDAAIKATDDWDGGYNITRANMIEKELNDLPSAEPDIPDTNVGDMVSRQAAIDAILRLTTFASVRELYEYVQEHNLSQMWSGGINDAIDAVIAVPTAEPEQRWIPCSERLPEEDHWLGGSGKQFSDNVLVSIYNSDDEDEWVDVSQTIDGEWRIELLRQWKIVAWMPLPEPYKEGDSDEQQDEQQ